MFNQIRVLLVVLMLGAAACQEGDVSPDNGPTGTGPGDSVNQRLPDSLVGCNNQQEQALISLIREYRAKKGLDTIPVSQALTLVADKHVQDLMKHNPYASSRKCNLHSWSASGDWSACCYTPDHARAECMWKKPRELTAYKGNGYEIAFKGRNRPETALEAWKGSPPHNSVLMNKGQWKDFQWKAMGVSINGGYAVVWFGAKTDGRGAPEQCPE